MNPEREKETISITETHCSCREKTVMLPRKHVIEDKISRVRVVIKAGRSMNRVRLSRGKEI